MAESERGHNLMAGALLSGMSLVTALAGIMVARPAVGAPAEEKIDYLIDLQSITAQQLQRIVQIAERLTGEAPIVISPEIMPSYAAITICPETAIDFIQAGAPPGQTQTLDIALNIACLAGVTTQFAFRLPNGWVSTFRTPLIFTSDFYDPLLTVQAWLDESRILLTPWPMSLTGPRSINLRFTIKRFGMDVEFVNATATDALVTGAANAFWMEKSYYEGLYQLIVNKIYQAAEVLVQ